MKPAYEKVARAFKAESDCVVAQMDADAAPNKPIAAKYGVTSFPTIKFFPKDGAEPIAYSSGRSEEQFVDVSWSEVTSADDEYLNEHCGTHRTSSGLLSTQAGRVLSLDTLASSFFSAGLPERPAVLEEARQYLTGLGSSVDKKVNASADYYVKAMERVLEKGESWLSKEQARCVAIPCYC